MSLRTGLKMFDNSEEYLFGIHKEQVISDCWGTEFPGTKKWEADNPIWDCSCTDKESPRNAWKEEKYIRKAVDNLYWITNISLSNDSYKSFVQRIYNAFREAYGENPDILKLKLRREVLLRFTIAKICPKVTALQPCIGERIIQESGIDVSSGIYCPMAGFGGLIEGAKRYYKKNNMQAEIEAYDINPNFCKYYGWIQRDALSQIVSTDKVVLACPPFGTTTERWEGTPLNRNDDYKTNYLDFHDWCRLLKSHIIAPNYIFIGPEIKTESKYKSGKTPSGLFRKKIGVQYYPEYSL